MDGMDPTLIPCKQKMVVLFISSEAPFYDLLFFVMSGGIHNVTSIYWIRHCLLMEAVHYLQKLLRAVGLFAGSIVLMRSYGDLMAL
jgi:hypothetical protein